jgi:hypothetical protein
MDAHTLPLCLIMYCAFKLCRGMDVCVYALELLTSLLCSG